LLGKKEYTIMGQGGYVFCEWDSVAKEFPDYQRAFADLEAKVIELCNDRWRKTFGGLAPGAEQYGRTTILPGLFDPNPNTYNSAQFGGAASGNYEAPPRYWRQAFTQTGNQTLIQGSRSGETLPEDFNIAWIGLAFPNKNQHITEIRWQTSDRKYVRLNIEEMHAYNKPAIIFEEGFPLKEEQAFELYGYLEGPIPSGVCDPVVKVDELVASHNCIYQRIVMLGSAYYRIVDKVLGTPGAAI